MKNMHTQNCTLDEIATDAVRLGRELQNAAHRVSLGGNSRDAGLVERSLRRLAERQPFDPRDDGSLEIVRGILEIDLQNEVVGTEFRFVDTYCDDAGNHGGTAEFPVFSERGEALLSVREIFARFIQARDETLDRLAAERALRRLLDM